MKTQLNYFYSVLKNEDATPFVGNNLLVVADGLGGSGSTVHNIEVLKDTPLHDEIFQNAFYDFDWAKAQRLNEYLECLVRPMADGKPDTSALWGSRIAIARCVYALCCDDKFIDADLSDERVRKELAEFISSGLEQTVKYFKLEKGKYDDQKLLPTTLAFIRYRTDIKNKVVAEVVWAGDSRCYALTKDGLKLLSVDDEDESGCITNLFYVGGKRPTVLNYKRYVLETPCALMSVSDGVFDPFEPHDHFGVEATLLEHISENNSYDELMKTLQESYGKIHSDDATMAFAEIGFDDYADIQKAFAGRGNYVAEMWRKLCDINCALEVINQPEEDVRSYVETRTADKFTAIISQLIPVESDIAFTKTLKAAIEGCREKLVKAAKISKTKKVETAIESVRTYFSAHPEELKNAIANLDLNIDYTFKSALDAVIRDCGDITKAIENKRRLEYLETVKDDWRKVIVERENYYWRKFQDLRGVKLAVERISAGKHLRAWVQIDVDFERGFNLCNINSLDDNRDKQLAKDIAAFLSQCKSCAMNTAGAEERINTAKTRYGYSLDRLVVMLKQEPLICKTIFTKEIVSKFGLDFSVKDKDGNVEVKTEQLVEALYEDKDSIVKSIVDSLTYNYGKTSVIDGNYNGSRLTAFREYYKLKANPDHAIGDFEKTLNILEKSYENLLN